MRPIDWQVKYWVSSIYMKGQWFCHFNLEFRMKHRILLYSNRTTSNNDSSLEIFPAKLTKLPYFIRSLDY